MSSAYLHIPYCLQKCGYCDFFSLAPVSATELDEYVQLLQCELNLLRQQQELEPLQTIFFGGGTPSLLSAEQVGELLSRLENDVGLTADCEISMEANPGSLTPEKLAGYRQAGVNRLSVGVQTFNDWQLRSLGRIHTARDARQSVAMARQAGFENLSLDLIFALPGQTLQELRQEVREFCELEPEHLSCYGLTVETGTPLEEAVRHGVVRPPDDDAYAEAYLCLHESLETAGYTHYEISNYARPGFACRHNLGYWHRQSCLGLGAGAHSFRDSGWGERRAVANDLRSYRAALQAGIDPSETLEIFDRQTAMAETLYLGLRTRQGVSDTTFAARFDTSVAEAFPVAVKTLAGRLEHRHNNWFFRPEDWLLFDQLVQVFL